MVLVFTFPHKRNKPKKHHTNFRMMITSQEERRGDGGESLCVIPLKEKNEELSKDDKILLPI